jgi:hypothetical protein
MKNVIEVNATEHYINKETDDMVNEVNDIEWEWVKEFKGFEWWNNG